MASFMAAHSAKTYALMRIVVGFLFLWHGSQKVFGIPGGMIDMPEAIRWSAGPIELVGGLLVMIGLQTRWAAFLSSGTMAAAYWIGHGTKAVLPVENGGEAMSWRSSATSASRSPISRSCRCRRRSSR